MSYESPLEALVSELRATDAAQAAAARARLQAGNAQEEAALAAEQAVAAGQLRRATETLAIATEVGALAANKDIPPNVIAGEWQQPFIRRKFTPTGLCGWGLDEFTAGGEIIADSDDTGIQCAPTYIDGVFLAGTGELYRYTDRTSSDPRYQGLRAVAIGRPMNAQEMTRRARELPANLGGEGVWAADHYKTLLGRFAIQHKLLPPD